MSLQQLYKISFLAIFIALLFSNFIGQLSKNRFDIPSTEKRILKTCSGLKWHEGESLYDYILDLSEYLKSFSDCFVDQFIFRNRIIQEINLFRLTSLGVVPERNILKGRDGWYYINNKPQILVHTGENFNDAELEKWVNVFVSRKRYIESHGKKYYILISPDKPSIYPEFYPKNNLKSNQSKRLQQIINYIKVNKIDLEIIDVRSELLDMKKNYQLYYKTDSHWNEMGGFIAYQKLIRRIKQDFPSIRIFNMEDFYIYYKRNELKDIAEYIGIPKFYELAALNPYFRLKDYPEFQRTYYSIDMIGNQPIFIQKFTNSNGLDLNVVVFRDSYFNAINRFFALDFKHVDLLDYGLGIDFKYIDEGKYDIVVHEFVESKLAENPENLE